MTGWWPLSLEEALLFSGPHQILEQILARFILNLRPQTRNIGCVSNRSSHDVCLNVVACSPEVISSTVAAFFAEWMAKGERTTFWDERKMMNLDPFTAQDPNGFFKLSWDLKVRLLSVWNHISFSNILKLRILRQLVEWQLSFSAEIKGMIDRSWGVVHMKHKKSNVELAQETQRLSDNDPHSKRNLMMVPIGQDARKKRYWAVDGRSNFIFSIYLHLFVLTKTRPQPLIYPLRDMVFMCLSFLSYMTREYCLWDAIDLVFSASPRLYVSTNPWKVTATFIKVATTKDEYLQVIERLKETAPPPVKEGVKRTKSDAAHVALINTLENRVEAVDSELQVYGTAFTK